MEELLKQLAALGIQITPEFTGKRIRAGKKNEQWFIGKELRFKNGTFRFASFGNFKLGESGKWQEKVTGEFSAFDLIEFEAYKKLLEEIEREEQEKYWLEVAHEINFGLWAESRDDLFSPYLTRKGFNKLYGARVMSNGRYDPVLLVPMRDLDGKLWNVQRIYAEKLSAGTDKFYAQGAKRKGVNHRLGEEPKNEGNIYITEGFATGCSVFQALGENATVYIAFDTQNLKQTAEELHLRYPGAKCILCADNDAYTKRPDGSLYNTGFEKAKEAARAVQGEIRLPHFAEPREGLTDFNDLAQAEGLETVKHQLLGQGDQQSQGTNVPGAKEEKAPKKISETTIALAVLRTHPRPLIRQDMSVFEYLGTHWRELEKWDIDQIKNRINGTCGEALDSKKVNSIYATMFRLIDHVPQGTNLFTPNPKCGNFLDGTLRLNREEKTGVYCLSFSAHRKEDYLTWVIPVKYECDRSIKNAKWEALLKEALEGEPDAEGMLRSLKQMGGAMLVPTFPQLFFLFGISGSRKSTIAMTLEKLVDKKNISTCDPCLMENFQIEGMLGMLVNLHTDIADDIALPRGFLKRFEDQTEVQVNRKGKPVVKAKLPAVHVYCANKLPPNMEGSGKAFHRRVTLLEFKNDRTNGPGANVIKKFEELIWAEGYQGILNWCLEGLEDLVARGGKFFVPNSSREAVENWQAERDPVELFVRDVKEGDFVDGQTQICIAPEAKMERKLLWSNFLCWHKDTFSVAPKMDRTRFYHRVEKYGFKVLTTKGVREFHGIGVQVDPKSGL